MFALALLLAALVGLSLGLLGGGGSILTVPVLVYVLGYAAKPAIAMSLPVVGIASLVGAAMHWRLGNVQLRTAAGIGAVAMVGAFAGARLATFVSGSAQLLLLAVAMLGAALSMLREGTRASAEDSATPARRGLLALVAFGVGLLTGIVGIGGGFLMVPALVLLIGTPMREAVGTSLVVISLNSAAGFAGYLGTVVIDWPFLGAFTAAAVAGVVLGTAAASHVPQAALKRVFAVFLVLMGAFVFYKNRHALVAPGSTAQRRLDSSSGMALAAPAGAVASLRLTEC